MCKVDPRKSRHSILPYAVEPKKLLLSADEVTELVSSNFGVIDHLLGVHNIRDGEDGSRNLILKVASGFVIASPSVPIGPSAALSTVAANNALFVFASDMEILTPL